MKLRKKILIVDDNALNREMLVEILKDKYNLSQAQNGKEALDFLRKNQVDIDLILLDIMMPVMDGYTLLDELKKDEELSVIPVIVMTQGNSEQDELAALGHGASDFVPKPYRPQVVYRRIENLIKLRETAATINQLRYDRLTGLYSKEYFIRKVQERFLENPDTEYSIICSDVENFKLFNDVYGVEAGDKLLQDIASQMRAMVGPDGVCGRYGADKFVCLQEINREESDRNNFAKFASNGLVGNKKAVMRWGIYRVTDRSVSVTKMCDLALLAVNSIKGMYNRYFAVYDDVLREELVKEKRITDAMESALAERQFAVYLQPKFGLKGNHMAGAEALVRWNHPQMGIVSPGEFIPAFEKNGFISRLDRFVWEEVCVMLHEWQERGYPLFPVSVNVSRVDLHQDDLIDCLCDLTEKYRLDHSLLHLEITESVYSESQEQIIRIVNDLRDAEFVVEIDDFGSGYSSLSMLGSIKPDVLKLDMKFVRNETEKPSEYSILGDVVNMAHRLNLSVVAEGVETRQQIRRLQAIGCDYVQGYYFAKPMVRAEYEKLLVKQLWTAATPTSVSESRESIYRILLVEESQEFVQKVNEAFDDVYQIVSVSDAQSAIERARSFGANRIDAVILSMSLPDDGAKIFMDFLKSETDYWKVPVLATIVFGTQNEKNFLVMEADDFLCKRHPVFDVRRRVQRLIDVATEHKLINVLKREAHSDFMTGLLNRRGLNDAIKRLEEDGEPFALCLFDLDNLKKVNDTYGHKIGDELILSFTDIIRHSQREGDVCCRYGGDEFILILKNVDDEKQVSDFAGGICEAATKRFKEKGIPSSCSCGAILCNNEGKSFSELLERADNLLYEIKKAQKGSCLVRREGTS